jgi:protein-disulfide isomerase
VKTHSKRICVGSKKWRSPVKIVWFLLFMLMIQGTGLHSEAKEVLAEVNGVEIDDSDVEPTIGAQLSKLQEQQYLIQREIMDRRIDERLLDAEAAKRGISVSSLLDIEVTAKVALVTESEIDNVIQLHKSGFRDGGTSVRGQIRTELQSQKLAAQRDIFIKALRSAAKVKIYLRAPPIFRAEVSAEKAPLKGSLTAPVTIVKFEDFHCPFCQRVQVIFTELMAKYGGKLKLAHRDFPIDQLHPTARKAHEAARCAQEQGKFWSYHDVLYANTPNSSTDNLKTYAYEIGLDIAAFEHCINSNKYQNVVQEDIDHGQRLGVAGTPTFFINGRQLAGAQSMEAFTELIEDELARTQSDGAQ